ncbi:MAG: YfbM family protein [Lachnospira sp.]|nr:YfbM family protein [Lachnospira sp.]
MGMIACYQEVNEVTLHRIKKSDDVFGIVEELQEEDETLLFDMDKLWDGLHYLLTKRSASAPIDGNPLSEAVVGQDIFSEEDEDYIAYITPSHIASIVEALEKIDITSLLDNMNFQELARQQIYPNIWTREEEQEEIREDLKYSFEGLLSFYQSVLAHGGAVIVSIY